MADLRSVFSGFNLDTGGGSELILGVSLRLSSSGGSIEALGQQAMAASIPVVLASDQSSIVVNTELPAAGALSDTLSNPTTPMIGSSGLIWDAAGTQWTRAQQVVAALDSTGGGIQTVGFVGQFDDSSTATVTENRFAPVRISTRRALLVEGVASGTNLNVNLAASAATITVDSELAAASALSDNFSNPNTAPVGAFGMIWDSANWDRMPGNSTDGVLVNLGANNDVTFSETAPSNPATDYVTSAGVAAGAEANLDTGDLPAKKLTQVTVWSSVAYRARVFLVNNSVEATEALAVGGGQPHMPWTWEPPHRDYATLGTSGGTDAFRCEFVNLDDANASDAHCVFAYQD